ncbi:type I restriction-modification system subunit M [Chitinophagales bacterium]|nr:type I restriction-modification system subunit M [Chitinophagales bacterium]
MKQKELEEYILKAANTLREMAEAADVKRFIFPLLFYKRLSDVWDEEYEEALELYDNDIEAAKLLENYRFQIPDGCHWSDIRSTSTDIGSKIQKSLREIENANFERLNGVFGDAQWTNKRILSDAKLIDLVEQLSGTTLSKENISDDSMGAGFEFLVKDFAQDTGHTAADFYTNRTVIDLVLKLADPQPGESIYDPACGSGGFLLKTALYLKNKGKEYRNLKLFGQELKVFTTSVARINMFMHGIDEFTLTSGNTIDKPQILEHDEIKQFDVVMSNPEFTVTNWSQAQFTNDPYGRNTLGTPPQGNADYAFQQHILKSLNHRGGRSVTVLPHGVLFRDAEQEMRQNMIKQDLVEAVIGLGKNLFFGSSMECCLIVCRKNKPSDRKGKVLFIDAKNEIRLERSEAYLKKEHIEKIDSTYKDGLEQDGFSKIISNEDILGTHNGNLSIQLYVKNITDIDEQSVEDVLNESVKSQRIIQSNFFNLLNELKNIGIETDETK